MDFLFASYSGLSGKCCYSRVSAPNVGFIKRERGLENVVYGGVGEGDVPAGPVIPSPEGPDAHRHGIE